MIGSRLAQTHPALTFIRLGVCIESMQAAFEPQSSRKCSSPDPEAGLDRTPIKPASRAA
jgi:hypothetical protein